MPFSASTCLSYTGTSVLTGPITITTLGGTVITAVTLTQITTCPLVLTGIPDGTTTIKLTSANNFCCNVVLTCNNLCTTCNLAFDTYSTSIISRIVAGNLTGSCSNNITDYTINWYKSPDFTTPVFTSGHGAEFTPYNFTHPLVVNTSPMQPAGTYRPVVDRIKLNGLKYSQTGGTGFIQANLSCFNTTEITVAPFRCNNGTESGDYTHRVNFSGASVGVIPLKLSSTFEISAATTNYFAWKFNGFDVSDTLKITYYGLAYGYQPIILENYDVGSNVLDTDFSLSINPKTFKQLDNNNYFSKVTCLTGLTRNTNDYLTLEVIPNPLNPQTNWDFYFTCLPTFDCSLCYNDYLNKPYKIQLSSLNAVSGSCTTVINLSLSGCSYNSISGSSISRYMRTTAGAYSYVDVYLGTENATFGTNNNTLISTFTVLSVPRTDCGGQSPIITPSGDGCIPTPGSGTITFNKSNSGGGGSGVINMTFTDLSDFSAYYNSYLTSLTYSGTPYDNTDIRYYRYFILRIPTSIGSEVCGDGTTFVPYNIHYSSVVTTGFTSNYTLSFTMPTISIGMSFLPCDTCLGQLIYIRNIINPSSTGSTNVSSYSTSTSSRAISPINRYSYTYSFNTSLTAQTINSNYRITKYLTETIPYSGNSYPYTIIPSLSAITCNYSSIGSPLNDNSSKNIFNKNILVYDYKLFQTDPGNTTSYVIKSSTITNGVSDGLYNITAVTVVNNVVTSSNPTYTY